MNVETIRMDPAAAKAMIREYKRGAEANAAHEYRAVHLALHEVAKGRAIINLPHGDRPRLAVARADREQIRFTWSHGSTDGVFRTVNSELPRRGRTPANDEHRFDLGRRPHASCLRPNHSWEIEAYAMVPMVPPRALAQARLRGMTSLGRLVILWEVETWHDSQQGVAPSRDPYLLRHLGGDLYSVLAEWDLTPLEVAVIAGTRR
jgi:hypothetical protein